MSSELILYQTEDGLARVQLRALDGTVWLTQAEIANLFDTVPQGITQLIKTIYKDRELPEEATCKEFLQVRQEGERRVTRKLKSYSLEMILAIGYRVRSPRGTQFRQWATAHLSEYLVKGFTLDDERLKGRDQRADYFDELLSRIREIRASEARVYQRIREIFALAVDYHENEQHTQTFFATMQNKMHYAATGLTAAEIIHQRADAERANMGLTNWAGSRVIKRDVGTAKNYLDAKEIDTLNRIVVMFLDQAQFRAERRQDIRMGDWEALLDKFLRDTELAVLEGAGSVSHQQALDRAQEQYDAFAERRRQEAEAAAESRYLEDLRNTAKSLEGARSAPVPKTKKAGRKAKGEKE